MALFSFATFAKSPLSNLAIFLEHLANYVFKNLAIFCNQYLCAEAMISHGTLWLQRYSGCKSFEDLSCPLLFAYVLDLPEFFASISHDMLRIIGDYSDDDSDREILQENYNTIFEKNIGDN